MQQPNSCLYFSYPFGFREQRTRPNSNYLDIKQLLFLFIELLKCVPVQQEAQH